MGVTFKYASIDPMFNSNVKVTELNNKITANGGSSYTWTPGSLTGSTVAITPTVTTTYSVVGDNGSSCTNTQTVNITVNPIPTLTLTASSNTTISVPLVLTFLVGI